MSAHFWKFAPYKILTHYNLSMETIMLCTVKKHWLKCLIVLFLVIAAAVFITQVSAQTLELKKRSGQEVHQEQPPDGAGQAPLLKRKAEPPRASNEPEQKTSIRSKEQTVKEKTAPPSTKKPLRPESSPKKDEQAEQRTRQYFSPSPAPTPKGEHKKPASAQTRPGIPPETEYESGVQLEEQPQSQTTSGPWYEAPELQKPDLQIPETKLPKDPPEIIRAEITQLEIDTKDNGSWIWRATVKNTGYSVLDGRDLYVQGYSSPPSINWKPASGSIVSQSDIEPGQSVVVSNNWSRCCLTYMLKVDLKQKHTNNLIDTKMLSKQLWSSGPASSGYPFAVFITGIEWDSSTNSWRGTVTNHSVYTMKVKLLGYYKPQGADEGDFVAYGLEEFVLGVDEQGTTRWFPIPGAEDGDTIRVYAWYPSPCDEDLEDCYVGRLDGNPYKEIIIPSSSEFEVVF